MESNKFFFFPWLTRKLMDAFLLNENDVYIHKGGGVGRRIYLNF